jgi:hypothetical protein
MAEQIEPGAMVECADYPLGAVERVETDGALIVRPARADYLLRIPRTLVDSADAGRVCLKATLEDVEQYRVDAQSRSGPTRGVTTETTEAAPRDFEVLGMPPGELPTSPPT